MGKTKGTIPLVLAALALAFTVYMAVWNTNHDTCNSRSDAYAATKNCSARSEDQSLMLVSGGVAIVLLAYGLIRRYQPGGRVDTRPPE